MYMYIYIYRRAGRRARLPASARGGPTGISIDKLIYVCIYRQILYMHVKIDR